LSQESNREQSIARGVQFIMKTNEGTSWIMFASEPMELIYDAIRKTTVSSASTFTGIIRLALIPSANQTSSSTGLRRLIHHAGVYPVGGAVAWNFKASSSSYSSKPVVNSTSRYATVHFNFATQTMTDNSLRPNAATNALLMLALPHHAQLLPKTTMLDYEHFDLVFKCVKGPLKAVVGSSWSYIEPLLDLKFDGPLQDWDPSVRSFILAQVDEDLNRVLPTRTENVYGFGKQVARLAQLAHITKRLQSNNSTIKSSNSDQASSLLEKATGLLSEYLDLFLTGQVTDKLVGYDVLRI
jgi:endo-1,3(4)-beta-glucanase